MAALDDYKAGDDHHMATQHFAGQFCPCGDYGCPDDGPCVNSEY